MRVAFFLEIESLDQTLLNLAGGDLPRFDWPNEREVLPCDLGGQSTLDVQDSGATLAFEYENCADPDGFIIDGFVTLLFTNVDFTARTFDFEVSYDRLRVAFGTESQTLNGSVSIHTNLQSDAHTHDVVIDQVVVASFGGTLTNATTATLRHDGGNLSHVEMSDTDGSLTFSDEGQADFDYLPSTSQIHLTGAAGSEVFVTLDGNMYSISFLDDQGREREVFTDASFIPQLQALDGVNAPPMITGTPSNQEVRAGEPLALDLRAIAFDPDLDYLDYALEMTNGPNGLEFVISDGADGVFQVTAVHGGEFWMTFTATDPYGAAATDDFPILVLADSDADGIFDHLDHDDDDDGVPDLSDTFPFDPTESVDTDADGIGDSADLDDDNDGVPDAEDSFPLDPNCSDDSDGAGQQCFLSSIRDFDSVVAVAGTLYFTMAADKTVYRWDTNSGEFLSPWTLGMAVPSDSVLESSAYVPAHGRLYFGYQNGAITYVDTLVGIEQSFATVPLAVRGLGDAGDFLLAQDDSGAWATHYVFAEDGTLAASAEWNYYSRAYAYSTAEERIYFFRDDTSPNDLHYEHIDQTNGAILAQGETPYHGSYGIAPPIVVSPGGDLVLLGSGNIFDASDLTWVGAVPGGIESASWDAADGLIVLREHAGITTLERRDAALQVVEERSFPGVPRAILKTPSGYMVAAALPDRVALYSYQASDDSDGDGVSNMSDAFPLDAAASIDTDHDGYPDWWNAGFSEADSTSGLVVDAYPADSACYLPEHGDGAICDIVSTLPDYTPDRVVADVDGVIYLLSTANQRIYRYSAAPAQHLSPIIVGADTALHASAPTTMEYAPLHARLYLGYPSGAVSYVDLTEPQPAERAFTNVAAAVGGLGAAGDFLLVQDASGAWGTHYYFDQAGVLRDSADWNYFSTDYEWNETLQRIYFFRDSMSPNDLHYEEIQPLGTISAAGETPYHGSYEIAKPIVISPDDQYVLLGSGDIYRSDDLTWNKSLINAFIGGVWDNNGNIVTARDVGGATRIDRYDASQVWVAEADYPGSPLALIEHAGGYVLVTHDGLKPMFAPISR